MPTIRRPQFQDIQPPRLYRTGIALRRGFLTGPAATPEEEEMKATLAKAVHSESAAAG